jgi:hypothetical protein
MTRPGTPKCSTVTGARTGPNPTDRGKNGSKRHVMVDGAGTPLTASGVGPEPNSNIEETMMTDTPKSHGKEKTKMQWWEIPAADSPPVVQLRAVAYYRKRPPGKGSEVNLQEALLDLVFRTLTVASRRVS